MLKRAIRIGISVTLAAVSWQVEAASVHYYDQGSAPDAKAVAQLLTITPPEQVKASEQSSASSAHARSLDPSHVDLTLARERRINALAQAAVDDWQERSSRKGKAKRAAAVADANNSNALALGIHFENGSAQLPQSAYPALDAVARGIRMAAPKQTLLIEGHAAPSGNRARDLKLSKARAEAVKRYLVRREAMPAGQMRTAGVGSQRMLNPKNPRALENQRVQLSIST